MIRLEDDVNKIIATKDEEYLIFETDLKELIVEAKDNVYVKINDFRNIKNSKTTIKFIMNDSSKLIYNSSFINKENYDLDITTEYRGPNSHITYNIHGINDGGKTYALLDGIMGTKEHNFLLENIKLVNINGGIGTIIPNILIGVSDVVADHKATIGTVSKDEISYLMSKGLSLESSQDLILKGFLLNIFEEDNLKEEIRKSIKIGG